MSDLTVHHCTIRIVRHGGWGWGPEPRKLLQSAIKALPELLARALGELWPDDVEREFAAPVSIRVPLSMGQLLAVANEGSDTNSIRASPAMQALSERIGSAARQAFNLKQIASVTDPEAETQPLVNQQLSAVAESVTGSAILDALLSWHKDGVLHQRLAAFAQTALEAWVDRLIRQMSGQRESEAVARETIEKFVEDSALSLGNAPGNRGAALRRRLIVLTEAMARLGLRECSPALLAALERAFPLAERDKAGAAGLDAIRLRGDRVEGAPAAYLPGHPAPASSVERAIHELDHGGEATLARLNRTRASEGGEQSALPPHAMGMSEQATFESDHSGEAAFTGLEGQRASARAESTSPSLAAQQAESSAAFPARTRPQQAEPSSKSSSPAKSGSTLPSSPPATCLPLSRSQQESASPQLPPQEKSRRIASALPFLLLGPLARVGYLKALAATMEAAEALFATPLFATALAYKVLAPPARGWRREPDSIEAASAFAALSQPAPENDLVELARSLPDYLSPLDAALSGALISGHKREQPLLLLRTVSNASSGFLLLDVEGTFPLQWAASAAGLRHVLTQLDSSIVLIPQDTADVELLRWMDEECFRFVTDALPTRGEHWRALRRPPRERWWTNETIMSDSALVRTARVMRETSEEATTLWQALMIERPSIPLANSVELDRHLALAASTALGTIAWELWRGREQTTPLLALERFQDLEAQVIFSRDVVRVHLPRGKRFDDLHHHGLIEDVNDVPWFGGRTLTFAAG